MIPNGGSRRIPSALFRFCVVVLDGRLCREWGKATRKLPVAGRGRRRQTMQTEKDLHKVESLGAVGGTRKLAQSRRLSRRRATASTTTTGFRSGRFGKHRGEEREKKGKKGREEEEEKNQDQQVGMVKKWGSRRLAARNKMTEAGLSSTGLFPFPGPPTPGEGGRRAAFGLSEANVLVTGEVRSGGTEYLRQVGGLSFSWFSLG